MTCEIYDFYDIQHHNFLSPFIAFSFCWKGTQLNMTHTNILSFYNLYGLEFVSLCIVFRQHDIINRLYGQDIATYRSKLYHSVFH